MAAWAGAAAGHWVLRTAPIDQRGLRADLDDLAAPRGDALLSALAPGPRRRGDRAVDEPQSGHGDTDLDRQSLFAARGIDASPGRTIFGAPEQVAGRGPPSAQRASLLTRRATVALAAWQGPWRARSTTRSAGREMPTG